MVGEGPFFYRFCHLGERIPQGFAAVCDYSLGAVDATAAGGHVLGRCYLLQSHYEGAIFHRCALSIAA